MRAPPWHRWTAACAAMVAFALCTSIAESAEDGCAGAPSVPPRQLARVTAAGPWIAVSRPADDAVSLYVVRDGVPALLAAIARRGASAGQFDTPTGVALDPARRRLYVADTGNRRIQVFAIDPAAASMPERLRFLRSFDGATAGRRFCAPLAVALDAESRVHVLDPIAGRIRSFDAERLREGAFEDLGPHASTGLIDIAWDARGRRLLVLDAVARTVRSFGPEDVTERYWPKSDAPERTPTGSKIVTPRGIAADAQGHAYVVDAGANRVEVLDHAGAHVADLGTTPEGGLTVPMSVASHPELGVVVLDFAGQRLRIFDREGRLRSTLKLEAPGTVAGGPSTPRWSLSRLGPPRPRG